MEIHKITGKEISLLYATSDKVECLNCIAHLVKYCEVLESQLKGEMEEKEIWKKKYQAATSYRMADSLGLTKAK